MSDMEEDDDDSELDVVALLLSFFFICFCMTARCEHKNYDLATHAWSLPIASVVNFQILTRACV